MKKLNLEVVEANNLTSEAVAKRNVVLAKVNGLEELVSVLRSEIKIAKEGHSDARKAKQDAESLRDTHLEQIHELEMQVKQYQNNEASVIENCDKKIAISEERVTSAMASVSASSLREIQLQDDLKVSKEEKNQAEQTSIELRASADKLQGGFSKKMFFSKFENVYMLSCHYTRV